MFAKRKTCDLARDYALYAEFFKKMGDWTQTKGKMSKTIKLMQGCKADGSVKKEVRGKTSQAVIDRLIQILTWFIKNVGYYD